VQRHCQLQKPQRQLPRLDGRRLLAEDEAPEVQVVKRMMPSPKTATARVRERKLNLVSRVCAVTTIIISFYLLLTSIAIEGQLLPYLHSL
jgi:hypothetical protein